MARNGSGTFSRLYDWTDDAAANVKISSTRMDAEMDGMATALTDSIAKDGQTTPTANLPMGNFKHTGVAVASARTDYARTSQVQDDAFHYAAAGGTVDAITIALAPAVTAYVAGLRVKTFAGGANTGAVTLNVNGVGAQAVKKRGGTALAANDIPGAGYPLYFEHDGTDWELLNPVSLDLTSAQTAVGVKTFTNQAVFTAGLATGAGIEFEGATADAFETTLTVTDPTADNTITLPNATGTVPVVTDAVTATTEVVSSAAETTVYTKSIAGGTLGTNRALRLTIIGDYFNNSGSAREITIKVKYGATTISNVILNAILGSATRKTALITANLFAKGATNSQVAACTNMLDSGTATQTGVGLTQFNHMAGASGHNAIAIDSTAAQDLVVTIQHSASDANLSFKTLSARLELLS